MHERDLVRGVMFLKSQKPPPLGTEIRLDLTIPSGSTLSMLGRVAKHVTTGERGPGVELLLGKVAASDMWVIESALVSAGFTIPSAAAAVGKGAAATSGNVPVVPAAPAVRPAPAAPAAVAAGTPVKLPLPAPPVSRPSAQPIAAPAPTPPRRAASEAPIEIPIEIDDIAQEPDAAAAELDLVHALEAELAALRAMNPFQVLNVGYEADDQVVRAQFNELTKKYHPDRFARYESETARALAGEIFILVREAYRRLGDAHARAGARAAVKGQPRPAPPASRATPPAGTPAFPRAGTPPPVPRAATPPPLAAPPPPSFEPEQVLSFRHTGPQPVVRPSQTGPQRVQPPATGPIDLDPDSLFGDLGEPGPTTAPGSQPVSPSTGAASPFVARGEQLLDAGRYDEAFQAFDAAARSHPADRIARVGRELARGFQRLAEGDRLAAAQCFEAALEIDPMNERAARELASMRRAATDARRGLLGKLLGKKS